MTLAYIARGSIDAYQVDELYPWDICAGSLLIQEAGGFVCNSDGGDFDFMVAEFVAAATETLAQAILDGNKAAQLL